MLPRKPPPARFFEYMAMPSVRVPFVLSSGTARAPELMPCSAAAGITSLWSAVVRGFDATKRLRM